MTRESRYRIQRRDPVRGWVFACSLLAESAAQALAYAKDHFQQEVRLERRGA